MKLKLYMVKRQGKFYRRKDWRNKVWVDDPQKAAVWTNYQGPAAVRSMFPDAERIELEIDIEKAQIPQPE